MFDDAALFPPGNAPMTQAADDHAAYRAGPCADFVGPFICSADRLAELEAVLAARGGEVLDVALTVPGGPAALSDALRTFARCVHVRVVAVELPLGLHAPAEVAALRRETGSTAVTYVEVPVAAVTTKMAHALVASDLRLKLRTGGETADAFPDEHVLATAIDSAVRAGVAFKCTAGLHSAVRHRDVSTNLQRHGFLNVALTVQAALTGADIHGVQAALADTNSGHVVAGIAALDANDTARVRALFTSFGTCSVTEPLADLQALGLLPERLVHAQ